MTFLLNRRAAMTGALAATTLNGCTLLPGADEPSPVAGIRLKRVKSNGITMRVAEAGPESGRLIILVHGWPESWYSWRHQIPVLAAAGYHVLAPDMRGYGGSDCPEPVEAYDIHQVTADLVGLVDSTGKENAILVGHDWGAIVCWNSLLLHPARFSALAAMSVPYNGRGPTSPLQSMRAGYGENFYYILYFQEPGVAEAEFDADPRGVLSRLYISPDTPRETPPVTDPKRSAGNNAGYIPRRGAPLEMPAWLNERDLDYFVEQFRRSGFRGGINYYRNFHRNWETTPQLSGAKFTQPVTFIAGASDTVIRGATAEGLTASLGRTVTDLRGVTLFPGIGHWVQQESPTETNAALMAFLSSLKS